MTSINYSDGYGRPIRPAPATGLFQPLGRLVANAHSSWNRWQQERALEAMPADMRKDLGWPTSDMTSNDRTQ